MDKKLNFLKSRFSVISGPMNMIFSVMSGPVSISSNSCIMFASSNLTWTTRAIPLMDNTQFIIVFIFWRKWGSYISSFPRFYNFETVIKKFVEFLHKILWYYFIEFTIGYFSGYEHSYNFKTNIVEL